YQHPRRSNKKPDNYQLVSYKENPLGDIEFGFGCNVYCLNFPHSLPDSLRHDMGLPTFAKIARENMSKVTYIKPEEHLTKLSEVEKKLQSRACSILNNSIEEGLVKSIKWYIVADWFTNNKFLIKSDNFSCKITDLELAMMLIRAKLAGWVGGKNLFSVSKQEGAVLPIKEGLLLKSSSATIFFGKLVEYHEQEEEEMNSPAIELIELAFDGDVYVSNINSL
ncbi:MAG: hypothetical protein M1579_00840, partial [Gammaproteobacteria bacterium]|nr:hypothetical protein [Gammaproteobacteria bacterium]